MKGMDVVIVTEISKSELLCDRDIANNQILHLYCCKNELMCWGPLNGDVSTGVTAAIEYEATSVACVMLSTGSRMQA